jgi:hypothetical protein
VSDPRLERHRPALVYDPQEPYRAIHAASITDHAGNTLQRHDGSVLARAGAGLSLDLLSAYRVAAGDRLDEAGDPLAAAARFQADPAYAERVYGRVRPDGDRVWLQYWMWSYYNPKHLLGFGRHEGDWELVQVRLGPDGRPEAATYSQHENGEARDWNRLERHREHHPVVYVAPLSHACYFEPGAKPYVLGVDNPDGSLPPVLPRVEPLGDWRGWTGRWGASIGVLGGRFGGRSPASPARQGVRWADPQAWHDRARMLAPLRDGRRMVRLAGSLTYPRLIGLAARRVDGSVAVEYRLDPAPQRAASRLLVTLHSEDELVASHPARISGRAGTVELPAPPGVSLVRASAYNVLRQRSDPLATVVVGAGRAG